MMRSLIVPFAVLLILSTLGCGLSHENPTPELEAPPPVTVRAESRYYVATAPDGTVQLVRLDAETGDFEAEGEPLWTSEVTGLHYMGQDAAAARAIINDVSSSATRAYALESGAWVDLCARHGLGECYVLPGSRNLRFFSLHPSYVETDQHVRFLAYDGDLLGTHDGWPWRLVGWDGPDPWALRGSEDGWTLHHGATQTAFAVREGELPHRAFENHVFILGRDDRVVRYYQIPTAQRTEARCPDGSPSGVANDAMSYRGCDGGLWGYGDGAVVDLGTRFPEDEDLRSILHVEPGSYQVISALEGYNDRTYLRLYDPSGRLLSSVERTTADFEAVEFDEELRHVSHNVRGFRAGPTSIALFVHFWSALPGHDLHILESEHAVVVLRTDGETSVFPIEHEAVAPWFVDAIEAVYWVADGKLMTMDYRSGATRELQRDWTFHYL
jgi:hypothetical protein